MHTDLDGLIWGYSPLLDLEICWDDGNVQLRDHYTKEFQLKPEQERQMRESETTRADAERQARLAAEERIRQLEAQIQQQQDT